MKTTITVTATVTYSVDVQLEVEPKLGMSDTQILVEERAAAILQTTSVKPIVYFNRRLLDK